MCIRDRKKSHQRVFNWLLAIYCAPSSINWRGGILWDFLQWMVQLLYVSQASIELSRPPGPIPPEQAQTQKVFELISLWHVQRIVHLFIDDAFSLVCSWFRFCVLYSMTVDSIFWNGFNIFEMFADFFVHSDGSKYGNEFQITIMHSHLGKGERTIFVRCFDFNLPDVFHFSQGLTCQEYASGSGL